MGTCKSLTSESRALDRRDQQVKEHAARRREGSGDPAAIAKDRACRQDVRWFLDRMVRRRIYQVLSTKKPKVKEFSVSSEDLWQMWQENEGCCAVTGIPMETEKRRGVRRNPFQVSLDRIDSKGDYVKGNVRLVLLAVNIALNEWGMDVFLPIARAMVAKAAEPPK